MFPGVSGPRAFRTSLRTCSEEQARNSHCSGGAKSQGLGSGVHSGLWGVGEGQG